MPSGRLPPSQGCTGVGAFCASMNVCERYTCMICLTMYAYIHTYIHTYTVHTHIHACIPACPHARTLNVLYTVRTYMKQGRKY